MLSAAGLAAVVLSGCSTFGSVGDQDTVDASTEAASQLQDRFEDLPGVALAEVRYQDDLTVGAQLRAAVEVEVGTDVQFTLDAVEEACWRSEVDPLDELVIVVSTRTEPLTSETRSYDLDIGADVSGLTERWGERP
ncbi:hypothetical protein SAMN05660199_01910 [Klenkia soli]|uniref:Uncharacterized protein n=1 Tax=Klenkia soli TaxID=1052260 RepID=A0A1H0J9V1_9ACTN|nr:hypothetical protein [Klenkia soli]SDO40382.1 hypothetical protein SAMN05660199_01910 [Klenkia soli]